MSAHTNGKQPTSRYSAIYTNQSVPTETFLTTLFDGVDGFIEIRAIQDGKPTKQQWFKPANIDKLLAYADRMNRQGYNIYFGVASRPYRKGKKADCIEVQALWVDLDHVDNPSALHNAPLPPSVIVASGGGYHGYWLLDNPTEANPDTIEPILKGLADAVGGDQAATDVSRVIRLPGTVNTKPDRDNAQCEVITWKPDRRYSLADFDGIARPAYTPPQPTQAPTRIDSSHPYATAAIDGELNDLAQTPPGNRHAQLISTAARLGNFVGAGCITRNEAQTMLQQTTAGWEKPGEVERTINDGLERGEATPAIIPENNNGYHPQPGGNSTAESATDGPRWQLMGLDELLAIPPPEKLRETPVQAGGLNVLFGPPESGKSFLALDYSLQISQDTAVLYVAAEGQSGCGDRVLAWVNHNHADPGYFRMLQSWEPVNLLDNDLVESFINTLLLDFRPALIVFDTLAWCMPGGDENSARDMGLVMVNCRKIQQATGAAILLVHHTTKVGNWERGSSALRGAADVMIELTNDDGFITLSCAKSKDSEPFEDQYLRMIPVASRDDRQSMVLIEADRVLFTADSQLTNQQRRILDTLAMETFAKTGAKASQIMDESKVSRGSIYRQLSTLMKQGYVSQADRGEPFYLTDKGKDVLGSNGKVSSVSKEYHDTNDTKPKPESSKYPSVSHPFRGDTNDTSLDGDDSSLAREEKITVNLTALVDADGDPEKALQLMRDDPARYPSAVKVDRRKYQKPPTDESAAK